MAWNPAGSRVSPARQMSHTRLSPGRFCAARRNVNTEWFHAAARPSGPEKWNAVRSEKSTVTSGPRQG